MEGNSILSAIALLLLMLPMVPSSTSPENPEMSCFADTRRRKFFIETRGKTKKMTRATTMMKPESPNVTAKKRGVTTSVEAKSFAIAFPREDASAETPCWTLMLNSVNVQIASTR